MAYLNGIDVSNWQNGINLAAVPADFVICKATQGNSYVSPDCVRQVEQGAAAGKLIGTYHYISGSGAVAEADFYLNNIKNWIGKYMMCLDWESNQNSQWGNESYLKQVAQRIIERTGIPPVIYVQQSRLSAVKAIADELNCGLWVAQYANMDQTGYQATPWNEGAYTCAIRQYSSAGRLSGYSGNLDLNKFYGDRNAWLKYCNPDGAHEDTGGSTTPFQPASPTGSTLDLVVGVMQGEYGNGENQRTFRIAGMTDEGYYMGPMSGIPPTVIVSDRILEGFLENTSISKAGIKYAEEYDEETENEILTLIRDDPEADGFSWESKLESLREVESAQGNMKEVGTGISLILALIGILNYVNTVTGNIQSRRTELAIMESVGMTDRQRNRLLVTEGLFFAAGSLMITATVGLAATYAVYQSMNYMQVPFVVPVWPAVGMAVFITAVCAGIPVIAGAGMVRKGSVVERVRQV